MYEKLVKSLRITVNLYEAVGQDGLVTTQLIKQAADAIEELSKRINTLTNCINEAEDALDRGADNDWARAALKKAEEKLRGIPVTEQLPEK